MAFFVKQHIIIALSEGCATCRFYKILDFSLKPILQNVKIHAENRSKANLIKCVQKLFQRIFVGIEYFACFAALEWANNSGGF